MVSFKLTLLPTLLSLALSAIACENKSQGASPAASASASASPTAAASAKPPEKPWFVGSWQAEVSFEPYQIEQTKQEGKVKAWAEENSEATGKGQLKLEIDEAGSVTGSATGALGELAANGTLDGDTLRVRFQPTKLSDPPEMFTGVLLAEKSESAFSGDLKASSGDSLKVRKATVTLAKAEAKDSAKGP